METIENFRYHEKIFTLAIKKFRGGWGEKIRLG